MEQGPHDRVLIVDDEPANVALLDRLLRRAGYTDLISTTDPREAMDFVRAKTPDIVLLDLFMPHVDGFALMARFRSSPTTRSVPIVVLTADVASETKKKALSSGANDFLTKPFEHHEVLARVANLLETRRLHLELARHNERLEEEVQARSRELRETEARLFQAQKMEAIGQLAGGVAHDFNNLLAVIINYAALLLEDMPRDDPLREEVQEIQRAGERAAALTRQLLAFSRKEIVKRVVLDLNHVVEDMQKLLRRTIGENVELVVDLAEELLPTKIDPGQVEQVVINLAVNARDAMPRGGRLSLKTFGAVIDEHFAANHAGAVAGDYVCIQVADTGTGMTDEVKARLFEPFFTTKERGVGTGLGLATVYGIVKQVNGYIDVTSVTGGGSLFTVYFPATSQPLHEGSPPAQKGRIGDSGATILVAEDEAGLRRLIERLLHRNGFEVLSAASGDDAREVAERHDGRINLLLTDLVMPGISGKELSEVVGQLQPDMPTIYMSGYSDQIIGDEDIVGDEVLLRKPFTEKELVEVIHDTLRTSAAEGGRA